MAAQGVCCLTKSPAHASRSGLSPAAASRCPCAKDVSGLLHKAFFRTLASFLAGWPSSETARFMQWSLKGDHGSEAAMNLCGLFAPPPNRAASRNEGWRDWRRIAMQRTHLGLLVAPAVNPVRYANHGDQELVVVPGRGCAEKWVSRCATAKYYSLVWPRGARSSEIKNNNGYV